MGVVGTPAGWLRRRPQASRRPSRALAHGLVFDRQSVIESLNDSPPGLTYDITDERVLTLSDDHVILVCASRGYRDQDEQPFVALMSSSYVRQKGV